jgi:hypothetical protein
LTSDEVTLDVEEPAGHLREVIAGDRFSSDIYGDLRFDLDGNLEGTVTAFFVRDSEANESYDTVSGYVDRKNSSARANFGLLTGS